MKKNYVLLFAGFIAGQTANAQTLTRTACEPAAGDIHQTEDFDSTTVLPRNTGTNQTWNFSSLVSSGVGITSSTFVTASSVPSSSVFPGATLAEGSGMGTDYRFYRSATTPATQFEFLGTVSTGTFASEFTYTNTAVMNVWPFSIGSTYTDTYAGPVTGMASGSYSGSSTVTATGTGTITMPGGASYPNILQVKTNRKDMFTFSSPFALSATNTTTQYDYYEPSQKFPLLTITMDITYNGLNIDTSVTMTANKMISVGIRDNNLDASYAIYPNPAKDSFSVKLSNAANEPCTVEVYDVTGRRIKTNMLGNASLIEDRIVLSGLAPGVYTVITALGEKRSAGKLIIE